MNDSLRQLVHDRLSREGLQLKPVGRLILASCDGREAAESVLLTGKAAPAISASPESLKFSSAYLTSLAVQGFRGIGPKQTLTFTPGPGLTVVVGRNGSGKSSFAEAVEVLFTGDSKRWAGRSKIWKEGWRNLHQAHPTTIEAELLLEGAGPARLACEWRDGAPLEAPAGFFQAKGKPRTTLDEIGWSRALVSYRPFLSYNELGSMLDEGPSKLYDALSLVLGLEDLVNAQTALSNCRIDRERALRDAESKRTEFIELLKVFLADESDDRATACLDALSSKGWGLNAVEKLVAVDAVPPPDQDISVLTRTLSLDAGDADVVASAVAALRTADAQLKSVAGSDAEKARRLVGLLKQALEFHKGHGEADCPVCGTAGVLTARWRAATEEEISRLQDRRCRQ